MATPDQADVAMPAAPCLADDLQRTLAMVAAAAKPARDRWWIIGSAALALHGVTPIEVGDVDLLMSPRDARRLLAGLGLAAVAGAPSDRFRSAVFGRWATPPLVVEVMAGFEVAAGGGWRRIRPVTRRPVDLDGQALFVPSRADLRDLLGLFGRPKDRARIGLLDAAQPPSGAAGFSRRQRSEQ